MSGPRVDDWQVHGPSIPAIRIALATWLTDDELVDRAIDQIDATSAGGEVASVLRERRDRIVVLDEPGGVLPGGAGGRWDTATQKLYILRSELEHPAGATLLAHEAVHMRDGGSRLRVFGDALAGIGRAGVDMLLAPAQLRNPVTAAVDGIRGAFQIPAEVDAYHLQAQVARELGLRSATLHREDGSPRSREELRDWLVHDDLYQLPPAARGAIGGGFAVIGGRASGQLANAAIARLAPQSWVGRHPIAVTTGALALWAGLLAQDQVAARRD